jgi:hypothetical protein
MRYRGYRLTSGSTEHHGLRATPIVVAETAAGPVIATMPAFWENFPSAISAGDGRLDVSLFPGESQGPYELQGGEQKTREFVIAFGDERAADPPLAWVHDPLVFRAPREWVRASEAMPALNARAADPQGAYRRLVDVALDDERGLLRKREQFDEYGWRHFGELPADHESAHEPPGNLLVSHYNNQYDGVAAFARQFLETGDRRWWRLLRNLARHVVDIDCYHTTEDKPAYSGGLFWHTQHYTDAGLSTHRTYPPGTSGGGPAAEHNYNAGLMWHYYLTGDRASRDAAIALGEWVIRMDDGEQTSFRWLARGRTGVASATYSRDYHGPGRGPANSIVACLVARRLSGDRRYQDKADELVRRCVHPLDDVTARDLLNIEPRWSYTVFMQALGVYLQDKEERDELDAMFFYARDSLLSYARWMAAHEQPYLDVPERLEFPNETWAAQDLRKADVLALAAEYSAPADRQALMARARFFFDHATASLLDRPNHHFTRPLILVLVNGPRASLEAGGGRSEAALARFAGSWPAPVAFRPQQAVAMRRAKAAIAVIGIVGLAALAATLARLIS